jgi:hypothetical protein
MRTPLILAVVGGHIEVVKLLVENKCAINICDNDGQTPLINLSRSLILLFIFSKISAISAQPILQAL